VRIVSLSSGSNGNACVVEHDGAAILIDCGIGPRTLKKRMADSMEYPPSSFEAVLLTHSHSDHVCGLKSLVSRNPDIPVYANEMTAETVVHDCGLPGDSFACFENGQSFSVGPFEVSPFSIPHDTSDPVGFLVRAWPSGATDRPLTYFHCTDVGTPLDSVGLKLAEADVATLESNHDPVLLKTSGRSPSLIQRICGPRGHLSNEQACELVVRFASPHLRVLALAHLSGDCNAPHVAHGAMSDALARMGRSDVALKVLSRNAPVTIL
jgi:phosphoribosyl 1,2-cyclic phosphodiesterase